MRAAPLLANGKQIFQAVVPQVTLRRSDSDQFRLTAEENWWAGQQELDFGPNNQHRTCSAHETQTTPTHGRPGHPTIGARHRTDHVRGPSVLSSSYPGQCRSANKSIPV